MTATKYLTAAIILCASASALADHTVEHNADNIEKNRQSIQDQRDLRFREDRELDAGIALSNALGSHQFDFDHNGFQGSIGVGGFRGDSGISAGFAIKPSDDTLLNFSFGQSSRDDEGASMSLNFRF